MPPLWPFECDAVPSAPLPMKIFTTGISPTVFTNADTTPQVSPPLPTDLPHTPDEYSEIEYAELPVNYSVFGIALHPNRLRRHTKCR